MVKTKTLFALSALGLSLTLGACSGGSSKNTQSSEATTAEVTTATLTPESSSVAGEYGDLFSVVEGTYELGPDGYGSSMGFTMERVNAKSTLKTSDVGGHKDDGKPLVGNLTVEFLDASGVMVFDAEVGSDGIRKLMAAKAGDKIGINVYTSGAKKLEKITQFRVAFSTEPNPNIEQGKQAKVQDLEDVKKAAKDMQETVETAAKAAKAIGALGGLLGN